MSVVSDDFQRANESPLAAPWANSIGGLFTAGVTLVSNQASGVGAVNGLSQYSTGSWGRDQVCTAVVGALTAGTAFAGVGVRLNTAASGYILQTDGTTTTLVRYNVGVATNLVTGIGSVANGDTLQIRVAGPNLSCYKNGALIASATDSNLTLGNPGILAAGPATLDNFFGSEIGAAFQPIARGGRGGRGGLLLRIVVPKQTPSFPATLVLDDAVYSFETGDLTGADDAGEADTAPTDWYADGIVPQRADFITEMALGIELPTFGWDDPDMDGALYPDHWSQAPPIDDVVGGGGDLPQQGIVEDGEPLDDADEAFGFDAAGVTEPDEPVAGEFADDQLDDADEDFGFTAWLQDEPGAAEQPPGGEDSAEQTTEEPDEDFGFSDSPLSADDLPQQGITEDGSYQDPEDEPFGFNLDSAVADIAPDQIWPEDATTQPPDPEDEDFGFADAPLAEDAPQLAIIEDASGQPPDVDDEAFGFDAAPLAADVQSDQVFVELGNTREDDIGEEDFAFSLDQAAPEVLVQSDQVFVEDAANQPPHPEDGEDYGFAGAPLAGDEVPTVFTADSRLRIGPPAQHDALERIGSNPMADAKERIGAEQMDDAPERIGNAVTETEPARLGTQTQRKRDRRIG